MLSYFFAILHHLQCDEYDYIVRIRCIWFVEWDIDESLSATTHTITYTIKKRVKLFDTLYQNFLMLSQCLQKIQTTTTQ